MMNFIRKKQKKDRGSYAVVGAAVVVLMAALFFCFYMVNSINRKMNESAASNLLNTTKVIQDTLENFLQEDLNSLEIIGNLSKDGEKLKEQQIKAFCKTLGFDWIYVVDEQGEGVDCFAGKFRVSDLPCYDEWTPEEAGYSDAYIGETGRSQIVLWVPIYTDGRYIGTVFGGVILTKYYSANIFSFYEGEGRTYLFDASDGTWILKSLGTDGTATRQADIYSLLLASGNREGDVSAFRQAVEERKTGTAVFYFNAEQSYLCFLPLTSSKDWCVTTVIAKDVLLRESSEVQRMIRWVMTTLCLTLVFAACVFVVWRIRKSREAEIHYRERLFANISANFDSAFLIFEKSNKSAAFVSENVKRLLGLNREKLREDTGYLFDWCGIPEEDPQRIAFLSGRLEGPVIREVCVEDELGESSRVIRLELIPTDLEQELAVLTDITSDKEIQSSLIEVMHRAEAASNAKNDFLSAMSHDLRTPINGIVGMTAIAAANLEDKRRVQDCLAKINESTAHLLSLINEVLDMSQIESGKIELAREAFNLAELLQNVLNINYPGIQQKNHTVHTHIHLMEHEEVIGDPARLMRIVANLISNAIKYTPSGGTITLDLMEKPSVIQGYGCYELMVKDNGIGMSEQFQEKLFEPFEREEDVRISRIQGTGLGMSIVKSIVELMMGSIQVESEKGSGSVFRVTFNLQLDVHADKQDEQLAGLPVLVVDDDVLVCQMVTEMLCDIGMEGEWTDSGADAVQMIMERHKRRKDYLAVLLDWKLPGMDGVETARRIRREVDPHVPIIILTAYDWGEIEEEAREAGIDAFLSKPVYKSKLVHTMTEITSGHPKYPLSGSLMNEEIPKGRRVLIVEDNELNKEIVVELLRMMGVETDCADNGAEAVELFAASKPETYDLILMDIQMPKMNGYEATRIIRRMSRSDSKTVAIVAMTADAFKKDEQAAREAGMNEHLAKPISIERLTQILLRFLKK